MEELAAVMILRLGKDHFKVKAWRPIVLATVVGKLGKEIISEEV